MKRGKYVGPDKKLRNQTALIKPTDSVERVLVQFDDMRTGYGLDWHNFRASDFVILSEEV
jgi:hypothetical protein